MRTKNEKEIKKQEINNLKTICISKNGECHRQGDSISFFKVTLLLLSLTYAPHHNSKFIERKKRKKMQDNEGADESLCSYAIKKLKMSISESKNGNKKSGPGRRRLGLVGASQ
jgi:hypothetical protein